MSKQTRRPARLTPEERVIIRQMIAELAAEIDETRRSLNDNLTRLERLEGREAVAA